MKFLHFEVSAGIRNIIQVKISSPANVKLMDTFNFNKYKLHKEHNFLGGYNSKSLVEFTPKESRLWHVIVDLEDNPGEVVASVNILKC